MDPTAGLAESCPFSTWPIPLFSPLRCCRTPIIRSHCACALMREKAKIRACPLQFCSQHHKDLCLGHVLKIIVNQETARWSEGKLERALSLPMYNARTWALTPV